MAIYSFFASLASILSLAGWAGEKYAAFTSETMGIISFFIIGSIFIFSIYLLLAAFISYEKIRDLHSDHVQSHRITHNLRNAITSLQDLEFSTLDRIDTLKETNQFPDVKENNKLKRQNIFKELGANITGSVTKQIENHFTCNGYDEEVRVTIKSIIHNEDPDQLNWRISTVMTDPQTSNNHGPALEREEDEDHKIGKNSDFKGIMLGDENHFVCNNLEMLGDNTYENSSKDWRRRYNATMVIPIKSRPNGKENSVYYGFLTADSKNKNNKALFNAEDDAPTINIMAHAADALAV